MNRPATRSEGAPRPDARSRPNLLYIFADQLRRDLGCYGNPHVLTPNLDRLASQGVRFDVALANTPQCGPARGTLLTGVYPAQHGVFINDTPLYDRVLENRQSIAWELRRAGYKTGYIGKWHLFGTEEAREAYIPPGMHRMGFDDFWAVLNCGHRYLDSSCYIGDSPEKTPIPGYEPEFQTELAIDFIAKHAGEPFALFLSYGPPHNPYEAVPDEWLRLYDPDRLPWRPNVRELDPVYFGETAWYRRHLRTPQKRALAGYYAHISALDALVGRILGELDRLGLAEETIVVVTSDHGDMLWSHGAYQKNAPWEESIGIPFLLRYPKRVPKSSRVGVPFGLVDVMPTLLGLMSLPIPDYAQGTDFSGVMLCGSPPDREAAYLAVPYRWHGYPEWRGVRTERYTYARSFAGPWVLYDNVDDPYQLKNLAGDASRRSLLGELDALTTELGSRYEDPMTPWEVMKEEAEARRREWLQKYGPMVGL